MYTGKLVDFFTSRKSRWIGYRVTLGNTLKTGVYARLYHIKILSVEGTKVNILVLSEDLTPLGLPKEGTNRDYGSITIDTQELGDADVNETVSAVVKSIDSALFKTHAESLQECYYTR